MTAPIAPDDAIGRISRMDAINNKSVTKLHCAGRRKIKKPGTGFIQAGTPDFGICIKCRKPIPAKGS